ncbi:unnamed protein product [Hyaloperonospora brassicae]|uniref:RxLR effector protein n=1 Tax=Hyaloperonospora brassicae TaxID=162125 RepID=A0AAV0TG94_HYABA|nr:unnamed protein product [Hyaloperonospora brassicae]
MRVLCLALVSAAALAASAHGLQVKSDVALSLETAAEDRLQPFVEGKTERFLKSEEQGLPLAVTSADYAALLGQEDGVGRRLRSADNDFESFDEERSSKKKKKKGWLAGAKKAIRKGVKRHKKRHDDDYDSDEMPASGSTSDVDLPSPPPPPRKKSWFNWGW